MNENKFLHMMNTTQACKLKVRHFYAKQCCTICGSKEKYLPNFNPNTCVCVGCYPNPWEVLSHADLTREEKANNKKKQKLKKENWSIPTVYGGYNTI